MRRIVGILGLKGGSTKSTVAVNLACELANKQKVLLFDADEQGTATYYATHGTLPIQVQHQPLNEAREVENWTRKVLATDADVLVIDGPPRIGLATKAIVAVADLVLVPFTASTADLVANVATMELIKQARAVRKDKGPRCVLVPSRVDLRTTAGREIADALKGFKEPVGPVIRQRSAFVDAFSSGVWVGEYAPNSDAHQDITALGMYVRRVLK